MQLNGNHYNEIIYQNIRNVQFLSILSRFITHFRKKELSMEKKYFSRGSTDKDGIHSIGRVYSRNVILFIYIYIYLFHVSFFPRVRKERHTFFPEYFSLQASITEFVSDTKR